MESGTWGRRVGSSRRASQDWSILSQQWQVAMLTGHCRVHTSVVSWLQSPRCAPSLQMAACLPSNTGDSCPRGSASKAVNQRPRCRCSWLES